jgi:riboflavin synthase
VFTGIVGELGRVAGVEAENGGRRLRIEAPATAAQLSVGDSVSVGGCCLTAIEVADGGFVVSAVTESIDRTTLGALAPGDEINLESALRAGDPLGGHYVQGHVDGVGRVAAVEPEGESRRVWIEASPELLRYCVEKGSIAVAGVSLTIAALREGAFEMVLIPHTLEQTTLGRAQPGDALNIEVDILAKYVEKLVHPGTIPHA